MGLPAWQPDPGRLTKIAKWLRLSNSASADSAQNRVPFVAASRLTQKMTCGRGLVNHAAELGSFDGRHNLSLRMARGC